MSHDLACGKCKGKGVVHARARPGAEGESRYFRSPSGSEREAAEAIYEFGGEASVAEISARLRITTAYAEMVCKSMLNRGYVEKVGRTVYALTPECEKAMEEREVRELERVTSEEKMVLDALMSDEGDNVTTKEIANRMGIKDVSYVSKMCKKMGERDLVDVLLSGKVRMTQKGEKVVMKK